RAFCGWTAAPGLLIDVEGHGRESPLEGVDLTRTVGWLVAIYPMWLESPESVVEQLRRVPHRGVGYGVLRYLAPATETGKRLRQAPQAEVCLNYLGQFDPLPVVGSVTAAHRGLHHIHSIQGRRRYVLDVNAHIADARLQVGITYSTNLHRRETIERLA